MKRESVVEIFKDKQGQFRFRVMSKNYKIVAQSEGYTTKAMCKKGIVALEHVLYGGEYPLRDLTKKE